MVDPISPSTVGAFALTEGIILLYEQEGKILKHWRDRIDIMIINPTTQTSDLEPITIVLPAVFEERLSSPQIHFDAVARFEDHIRALCKDLLEYVDGTKQLDVTNGNLLRKADALHQVVEAVSQQHITFKGEQQLSSGPTVEGSIHVDRCVGYAAAVRIRQVNVGKIIGSTQAGVMEAGSQLFGGI